MECSNTIALWDHLAWLVGERLDAAVELLKEEHQLEKVAAMVDVEVRESLMDLLQVVDEVLELLPVAVVHESLVGGFAEVGFLQLVAEVHDSLVCEFEEVDFLQLIAEVLELLLFSVVHESLVGGFEDDFL